MTNLVIKHSLRAEDIARIDLRIPPHSLSKKLASTVHPKESLSLMISLPSALALIAMGVPPGPKWFSRDFTDPELREIAERVHYEINDSWGPYLAEQRTQEGYFGRIHRIGPAHDRWPGAPGCADHLVTLWSPESSFTYEQVADKTRGFLDGILPTADRAADRGGPHHRAGRRRLGHRAGNDCLGLVSRVTLDDATGPRSRQRILGAPDALQDARSVGDSDQLDPEAVLAPVIAEERRGVRSVLDPAGSPDLARRSWAAAMSSTHTPMWLRP